MVRIKNAKDKQLRGEYDINYDNLADFARRQGSKDRKKRSRSTKKYIGKELTNYDKFNLPLRAGSVLHQGSREIRSWLNMAKDYGLLKGKRSDADKRAWLGEARNWVKEGRGWSGERRGWMKDITSISKMKKDIEKTDLMMNLMKDK